MCSIRLLKSGRVVSQVHAAQKLTKEMGESRNWIDQVYGLIATTIERFRSMVHKDAEDTPLERMYRHARPDYDGADEVHVKILRANITPLRR